MYPNRIVYVTRSQQLPLDEVLQTNWHQLVESKFLSLYHRKVALGFDRFKTFELLFTMKRSLNVLNLGFFRRLELGHADRVKSRRQMTLRRAGAVNPFDVRHPGERICQSTKGLRLTITFALYSYLNLITTYLRFNCKC